MSWRRSTQAREWADGLESPGPVEGTWDDSTDDGMFEEYVAASQRAAATRYEGLETGDEHAEGDLKGWLAVQPEWNGTF